MVRAGTRDDDPGWSMRARMAARLPRLLADLREHPGALALFLFGRIPALRRLVAASVARRRPPDPRLAEAATSAPGGGLAPPMSVAVAVETLRREGLLTGIRLDPDSVAAIRAFAETAPCHGGPDGRLRFALEQRDEAARRSGLALPVGHLAQVQRDCPAAAAIARDPWLRAVAAGYLGARPILIDLRLWWSFPAPGATRTERSAVAQDAFHFDLGDWHQLKAFLYLTDVGPEEGPHVFVRGSHARRPFLQQFHPFSARAPARLEAAYGAGSFTLLTGPAGTAFLEDPFGFHTGTAVRRGRRLILEVSFGITGATRRATLAREPG